MVAEWYGNKKRWRGVVRMKRTVIAILKYAYFDRIFVNAVC